MKSLNDISKNNPFKVPENYFEEFNRKIITLTENESEDKGKHSYLRLYPMLAVAASLLIIVSLGITTYHFINTRKEKSAVPEISFNEFTDNYLNDIDNLTLEQNTGFYSSDIAFSDVNSKDIVDYLVLENIDFNDIYEHLEN